MKAIAEQIKETRLRLKISQTQAAKAWEVSIGTLRGWEQGRREPRGGTWERLRAILAEAAPSRPLAKRKS